MTPDVFNQFSSKELQLSSAGMLLDSDCSICELCHFLVEMTDGKEVAQVTLKSRCTAHEHRPKQKRRHVHEKAWFFQLLSVALFVPMSQL